MSKHNIANLERVAAAAESPSPWTTEFYGEYSAVRDADGLGLAIDLHTSDAAHIANFNPDTAQAILRALREARVSIERVRNGLYHGFISEKTASDRLDVALANLDANFDFTQGESMPTKIATGSDGQVLNGATFSWIVPKVSKP